MTELPLVPFSYKPIDVHDAFGDSVLSCGKCRKPLYFPLVGNRKPTHCKVCGAEIDWEVSENEERC